MKIFAGVCYIVIGRELWGGGEVLLHLDENSLIQPALTRARKKKRKVVKMRLIVVIVSAICWLPYHSYFVIVFFLPGK